jgi:hypothetical protein
MRGGKEGGREGGREGGEGQEGGEVERRREEGRGDKELAG